MKLVASYWRWIVGLLALNGIVWTVAESFYGPYLNLLETQGELWSVRLYLASGLLLFDNLCVLWWYAHTTRELAVSAARQAAATEDEVHQNRLARWRENKPIVFIELDEFVPVMDEGSDEPHSLPTFLIRNTGNGPALNVFLVMHIETPMAAPIPLGALGAHEERKVDYGHSGEFRFVVVAEGFATRTRRWNATLNLGTRGSNRVVHGVVDLGPNRQMGDDAHETLDEFLEKNRRLIFEQLNALREPQQIKGGKITV